MIRNRFVGVESKRGDPSNYNLMDSSASTFVWLCNVMPEIRELSLVIGTSTYQDKQHSNASSWIPVVKYDWNVDAT